MLSDTKITYYQPQYYHDDGTNIEYFGIPDQLASFQVFATRESCIEWLEGLGYNPDRFAIIEYHDDDIEDNVLIDSDGYVIPRIEDFTDDEVEDMLVDDVVINAGSVDNLHACQQPDETEDQYIDRLYGEAHQLVSDAITGIEESGDYNFQFYAGTPEVEWYDKARDEAVRRVMNMMLGKDEYEDL